MNEIIISLICDALECVKDKACREAIERVKAAQREYLLAEADCRRTISRELIQAMNRLDIEKMNLEITLAKVKDSLTEGAIEAINKILHHLDAQREKFKVLKNKL